MKHRKKKVCVASYSCGAADGFPRSDGKAGQRAGRRGPPRCRSPRLGVALVTTDGEKIRTGAPCFSRRPKPPHTGSNCACGMTFLQTHRNKLGDGAHDVADAGKAEPAASGVGSTPSIRNSSSFASAVCLYDWSAKVSVTATTRAPDAWATLTSAFSVFHVLEEAPVRVNAREPSGVDVRVPDYSPSLNKQPALPA